MEKKILYLVYNFNLVTCMHKDKRGHKKKKKQLGRYILKYL